MGKEEIWRTSASTATYPSAPDIAPSADTQQETLKSRSQQLNFNFERCPSKVCSAIDRTRAAQHVTDTVRVDDGALAYLMAPQRTELRYITEPFPGQLRYFRAPYLFIFSSAVHN